MAPRRQLSSDEYNAALAATVFGNAVDPFGFGYGDSALGFLDGSDGSRSAELRERLWEEDPTASTAAGLGGVVGGFGPVNAAFKGAGSVLKSGVRAVRGARPAQAAARPVTSQAENALAKLDDEALKDAIWRSGSTTGKEADELVRRGTPREQIEKWAREYWRPSPRANAAEQAGRSAISPTSGLPAAEAKSSVRSDLLNAARAQETKGTARAIINRAERDGDFVRGVAGVVTAPNAALLLGYQGADELSGDASARRGAEVRKQKAVIDDQSEMSRKRPRR
jgi:hypothetical protein